MLTVLHEHGYAYVYREPTEQDFWRYVGNGYVCPPLVRENNREVYDYARGVLPPRYPVPAIRTKVTIRDWVVAICWDKRDGYGMSCGAVFYFKD